MKLCHQVGAVRDAHKARKAWLSLEAQKGPRAARLGSPAVPCDQRGSGQKARQAQATVLHCYARDYECCFGNTPWGHEQMRRHHKLLAVYGCRETGIFFLNQNLLKKRMCVHECVPLPPPGVGCVGLEPQTIQNARKVFVSETIWCKTKGKHVVVRYLAPKCQ